MCKVDRVSTYHTQSDCTRPHPWLILHEETGKRKADCDGHEDDLESVDGQFEATGEDWLVEDVEDCHGQYSRKINDLVCVKLFRETQ